MSAPTRSRSNGEAVTRAELGAHLERIDGQLTSLHRKMDALAEQLAKPQRWLSARLTSAIDRGLPIAVAVAVAYFIAELTHS